MEIHFYRAIFIAFTLVATHTTIAQTRKPNIIFIVADDLGYGNLTSYNPECRVPTPNIDRLGIEGIRYTSFYAGNTVCAPSRCALLTGKHMGHAYIRGNTRLPIRPQDSTLAQLLQQNGYTTGMFGKWGLGEMGTTGSPEIKGFDAFFGYLNQGHAHDYYTDYLYEIKAGKISKVPHDTTVYTHDAIMEQAFSFIRNNQDKPFFLFLPLTIPHAELDPPAKDIQPFLNGAFLPETPYLQNGGTYRSQQHPHAAFAAMMTKLDNSVGAVTALIKQLGLDSNTYIFFTSDNGPHKEGGADPEYFDSNGPLRGIKRDLYEGGIRVPMLVRAPGKVPAGRVSDQQWAFWDILPTFTDLTHSHTLKGIDGLSFKQSLTGAKQIAQHDYFYWQFNEGYLQEAVLKANWKLIRFKRKGQPEQLELYNLVTDIGEKNNLATVHPDKVKALKAIMQKAKSPAENEAFDWSSIEN